MANKIDHRRHYVLVLDTETANTHVGENDSLDMRDVLVYDLGMQVVDTRGNVYEEVSLVNRDIFVNERELMKSAYYAEKIPRYVEDLRDGSRVMSSTYEMRKTMIDLLEKYGIKEVAAHNSRFDLNALNTTQRYVTKSKYRFFFPYGIEIWDTMKMASDTICKQKRYIKFCQKHGHVTSTGRVRRTAEVLYRYITKDNTFQESHTGLEDVQIEARIMVHCMRQHKPMRKKLFEKSVDELRAV